MRIVIESGGDDLQRQDGENFEQASISKDWVNIFGRNPPNIANICQDNIFIIVKQLGDKIRELRTKQNLLLRQVASKLDVGTSIISKMERGERPIKKEQIAILADILKADKEEFHTLWLADQVMDVIKGDPLADQATQISF